MVRVRALALMDLGIAELWSSRPDDARRHLEEARALARRIGRPWVEIGCLGQLALAADERSVGLAREYSEKAIATAETHGLAGDPLSAIALAVFGGTFAWTGRLDEAERSLDKAEALRPEAEPATGLVLHHRRGIGSRPASGHTHPGARPRCCPPFPGLSADTEGSETCLTGELPDQAALYGVLAQLEALGLELLEVRRR
jgi:tetratricopeptide (TPR) repeat protein